MISISLSVLGMSMCSYLFLMKNDLFVRPIHSCCAYINIVYVDSLCAHIQNSTSHEKLKVQHWNGRKNGKEVAMWQADGNTHETCDSYEIRV